MGIDPIRPHGTPPGESPAQRTRTPAEPPTPGIEGKDSVELSPEAQQLQEAQRRHHLDRVRQRLATGFYSSPEVLQHVAQRLLEELSSKQA